MARLEEQASRIGLSTSSNTTAEEEVSLSALRGACLSYPRFPAPGSLLLLLVKVHSLPGPEVHPYSAHCAA